MGEAALSYEQEEFANQHLDAADTCIGDYVVLMDGETDDDWKYGSD